MDDTFDLQRFLTAQDPIYRQVLVELRSGRKTSHWMWFIFPQISGLGQSYTAQMYAIGSKAEAEAYLQHPVLGPRLRECTRIVNALPGRTAMDVFGSVDAMKFRSSVTLFARVTADNKEFREALQIYFRGEPDSLTLDRLSALSAGSDNLEGD